MNNIALLLFMTAFISLSANAACGGGGWKKPRSSNASQETPKAPSVSNASAKALPATPINSADDDLDFVKIVFLLFVAVFIYIVFFSEKKTE